MSKKVDTFVGTGRRKTASARVRVSAGSGKITVNGKDLETHCYTEQLSNAAIAPLFTTGLRDQVDVMIRVQGGGPNGQAGAIAHGLARALQAMDESLRPAMKQAGHMTRDPRMRERKKPGQPGARKRFQFSKR